MLGNDDVMEISTIMVPIKISLVFHEQQAILILVEHGIFAVVLIALSVFKRNALSGELKSLGWGKKLSRGAGHVGTASELQVVTTPLYHLSKVVFSKRVINRFLTSELMMHIARRISENGINFHLHVSAAFLEVTGQFLEWTLKNAAVFMQETLEQCGLPVNFRPPCVIQINILANIFIFDDCGSR